MKLVQNPTGKLRSVTYIAQRRSSLLVKIGSTENWFWREKACRNSGIRALRAVAFISGAYGWERKLHAYLEPDHVGGEWFAPTPRVLSTITKIAANNFDPANLPEGWCVTKPFQCKASVAHWGPLPRYAQMAESVRAEAQQGAAA